MNVLAVTSPAMWYLVRGTGAVSLVLLTASVVLGVLVTLRWSGRTATRLVVEGLHKNISLLVLVFLGLHVVTTIADSYVHISLVEAFVPFLGSYQPLWLGLGALAFDVLIALVVTSLVREHIGYWTWRLVHWSAYACWPLAFVHSIGIGTDSTQPWLLAIYGLTLISVVGVIWARLDAAEPDPTPLGSSTR